MVRVGVMVRVTVSAPAFVVRSSEAEVGGVCSDTPNPGPYREDGGSDRPDPGKTPR